MVTMGTSELCSTCLIWMRIGETPLPMAVRTKSWLRTSRMAERVVRMIGAARAKPSTMAGIIICCRLRLRSSNGRA